jgi:pilus assembly protein CpaB
MKGLLMDRRRILLVAAVLVAAMGAVLVFLYVQGADSRAEERFDTVDVLKATAIIEPGESIEDAQAAGKLTLAAVAQDELLNGYQTDTSTMAGTKAMQTIYPGEQIVSDKFGTGVSASTALPIPDDKMAISVNLTDPSRVAGFVNPGSEVAIFVTGTDEADGTSYTRMLLPRVVVLGVGNTTPVSTTTTDETGASTTEQLPRTLLTVSVDQKQAEKVLFAQGNGELAFGLLTESSISGPGDAMTFPNLFK